MRFFDEAEVKAKLNEFVELVSHGDRVTITRRGEPVAVLVPADEAYSRRRRGVLSLVGLFADWPQADLEAMVRDIYETRN